MLNNCSIDQAPSFTAISPAFPHPSPAEVEAEAHEHSFALYSRSTPLSSPLGNHSMDRMLTNRDASPPPARRSVRACLTCVRSHQLAHGAALSKEALRDEGKHSRKADLYLTTEKDEEPLLRRRTQVRALHAAGEALPIRSSRPYQRTKRSPTGRSRYPTGSTSSHCRCSTRARSPSPRLLGVRVAPCLLRRAFELRCWRRRFGMCRSI